MNNVRKVLILKAAVSVLLLFFLFRVLDTHQLLAVIPQANAGFLFAGILGAVAFLLIRAYKWFYIIKPHLKGCGFKRVLVSYMFGLGIGIFTPGRVGEVARLANLNLKEKAGPAGLFLVDKYLDFVTVLLMALAGIIFILPQTSWAVGVLVMATLSAAFLINPLRRFLMARETRIPFAAKLSQCFAAMTMVGRKGLFVNAALTVLSYCVCVIEMFFILRAFGPVNLNDVFKAHPLVMMTNIIPVTIGGLGLREGTSIYLYTQFGVLSEHAFMAGLLIFVFNILIFGIAGTVSINFLRQNNDLSYGRNRLYRQSVSQQAS